MISEGSLSDTAADFAQAQADEAARLRSMFLDVLDGMEVAEGATAEKREAKYSVKYPQFSEQQTEENKRTLARMQSVYHVSADRLKKTGKKPSDLYREQFAAWGNNIYSERFGDIALSNESVKSEIRHGVTAEKLASIEAIPTVINNGAVIYSGLKENGVSERIVVAAPITIADDSYYMGVMLQRDYRSQRLYLHNVVIEKETANDSTGHQLTTGHDETNERFFIKRILLDALIVKYNLLQEGENGGKNSLRQMFLDVLDGMNVEEGSEGGERFSIKQTRKMSWQEQVDLFLSETMNTTYALYVGETPENLLKIGINDYPIAMRQRDARKSIRKKEDITNKNQKAHEVPEDFLKNIQEHMQESVMFISNKNGVTVITDQEMLDQNKNPSFIVIGLATDEEMDNKPINQSKSIYPLDDFIRKVGLAAEDGNLIIINKEKAQEMLARIGIPFTERSKLLALSKDNLPQSSKEVNTLEEKNSLPMAEQMDKLRLSLGQTSPVSARTRAATLSAAASVGASKG